MCLPGFFSVCHYSYTDLNDEFICVDPGFCVQGNLMELLSGQKFIPGRMGLLAFNLDRPGIDIPWHYIYNVTVYDGSPEKDMYQREIFPEKGFIECWNAEVKNNWHASEYIY